jgi:hypothetical protein
LITAAPIIAMWSNSGTGSKVTIRQMITVAAPDAAVEADEAPVGIRRAPRRRTESVRASRRLAKNALQCDVQGRFEDVVSTLRDLNASVLGEASEDCERRALVWSERCRESERLPRPLGVNCDRRSGVEGPAR